MELEEVLSRLKKTIDLSKTLKDEQFDYGNLVTEFDYENVCGTVCCIAGHYPNWGIEGFYYQKSFFGITLNNTELSYYHGLSGYLIRVLFYGNNYNATFTDSLPNHKDLSDYSLQDVIKRFETVYKLLENKTITPNWNPYEKLQKNSI